MGQFSSQVESEGVCDAYLFSDLLPYDARHLIAIEFDDRVLHNDLLLSLKEQEKPRVVQTGKAHQRR